MTIATAGYGNLATTSAIAMAGYFAALAPDFNEGFNMSIDFRKYVRIISGVGGAASVANRELIGRLFTNNVLLSPDSVYEFTSADDVGAFFGFTSEEYLRAQFYFGWVSPNITMPGKISFARYTPNQIAPRVYGATLQTLLAGLQAVLTGSLLIKTPTNPAGVAIPGINLSSAGSYAAAGALVQTAIRTSNDPMLQTITISYDAPSNRYFVIGGVTGPGSIEFLQSGSGNTDLANLLGLYVSNGAWPTVGANAQTPTEALSLLNGISTNYGSFLFMPRPSFTSAQLTSAAQYNATNNNMYMMCWPVVSADVVAVNAAAKNIPGVAATHYDATKLTQYPEMIPMIQLAATDYTRRKGVSNYMFKTFNLDATVSDTPTSITLDAAVINYYGQTQINGQQRSFYQEGVLFGTTTSPRDQSVYANEMWLKDDITVGFFNTLLSLPEISANAEGKGICRNVIQSSITKALRNGAISVGKEFTTLQQAFITQQTGDDTAWRQVQGIGYWYDVEIVPRVAESGVTVYDANYLLIYGKDDAIHHVNGVNALV